MTADEKRSAIQNDPERTVSDSPDETAPPEEDATIIEESVADPQILPPDDDLTVYVPSPDQTQDTVLGDESATGPTDEDTLVEDPSQSQAPPSAESSLTVRLEPTGGSSPAGEHLKDDATVATTNLPPVQGNSADASDATFIMPSTDDGDHTLPTGSTIPGDDDNLAHEPTLADDTGPGARNTDETQFDEVAGSSDPNEKAVVSGGESGGRGTGTASGTKTEYVPPEKSQQGDAPGLGRFEILKLLGQGAFGSVYLAHDPHLDRKVAIKVAKTGVLVGKQDVDRFMREARSAAQLRHPNIVPVYEVGQLPNTNFIAYEYVEGRTLGDLLKQRKKLTCEEAVTYMRKIASGLHYAHQHGIVHRDVKPDNILLDAENEPHIADFGLARRDEGDTLRTREGMFMGTPSYMSPEQASGKAHLADARSDVWSLGVMLQEMLTGVRPFRGNVTEVLVAVQNYEPRSLRSIDQKLPKDLETIVEKCLTKRQDERYQSAQMLADELERWQRGEPILARPIGVVARTWRWLKRNPSEARLLGAIAVTILLAAIISGWFGVQAVRSEQRAYQEAVERAESQLLSVRTADAASLPVLVEALQVYRDELHDQLMGLTTSDRLTGDEQSRIRLAATTLYPEDPQHERLLAQATDDLLQVPPTELVVRTGMLDEFRDEIEQPLWNAAQEPTRPQRQRFQALAALASWRSSVPDWPSVTPDVVAEMLTLNPLELSNWLPAVRPIRDELEPALTESFTTGTDQNEQYRAAVILAELFRDTPETLVALVPKAEPNQLAPLLEALQPQADLYAERLAQQLVRVLPADGQPPTGEQAELASKFAVALIGLERGDPAWPLLKQSPNETLRTSLVHSIAPAKVPWDYIATRLEWEQDPGIVAALCLTLGEYGIGELLPGDRERLSPLLLKLFKTHPHPGVHSAAEWVLRKWELGELLNEALAELKSRERDPAFDWHVDTQGETFTVIEPATFLMGSPEDEPQRLESEVQHRRLIPRTFGIATREVTIAQYMEFDADYRALINRTGNRRYAPDDAGPAILVNWYDAIAFCRWLSEKEGFEDREMCYPPLEELAVIRKQFGARSLELPEDLLDRPGYRLPTAAEWEYAARAGTVTPHPPGNAALVGEYAWYRENGKNRSWPVGLLKPNNLGLFDIQGNVTEWCQNYYFDALPPKGPDGVVVDGHDTRDGVDRELRGGSSMRYPLEALRVAYREPYGPNKSDSDVGFRLARTYSSREQATGEAAR